METENVLGFNIEKERERACERRFSTGRDREIIKTKTTTTIMTMSKTRTMVFVRDGRDAGWRTEHGNPASCFGFFVFARRRCLFSFFFADALPRLVGSAESRQF